MSSSAERLPVLDALAAAPASARLPENPIAYFSMEIALASAMPTYAGGLGVLAADTLRSAADAGVPMVAMTLLHRRGYLTQKFDLSGWQRAVTTEWDVGAFLQETSARVSVQIEGRTIVLRAWRHVLSGGSDHQVPVFFLDADLPDNTAWDRTLTHYLYGGDAYYRFCQEIVLGIGGVRMLRALGYAAIHRFHLNEGHSSLLTLELLAENAQRAGRTTIAEDDVREVRSRCIFTTHTPVAAGHDQYPLELVHRLLCHETGFFNPAGVFCQLVLDEIAPREPGAAPTDHPTAGRMLNLTHLALSFSGFVNGVAKRHASLSQRLYAKFHIDEITNGVHADTWVSPEIRALLDQHIPGWEADNFSLRYAHNLPKDELWRAHVAAKHTLLQAIAAATGIALEPDTLTIGCARRFTAYKRMDLLFTDCDALRRIARDAGRLQLVFGGKAHPQDQGGMEVIQHLFRLKELLGPDIRLVYLENYSLDWAKRLVAGADIWLNTPLPPLEASGTSGMKAALNGVPSLSVLDGWWLEGCIEGITGWGIGNGEMPPSGSDLTARNQADAAALYRKLQDDVVPLYYQQRDRFIDLMRHAIAVNGSFFNTQRMIQQYVTKAYL